MIPLKELSIVLLIVWIGSFLVLIPSLLEETERTRLEHELWKTQETNKAVLQMIKESRRD